MANIQGASIKKNPLMFDNDFGKCGPIFKIRSPTDSQENSQGVYGKDFHLTCYVLLYYLVKFENPKMLMLSVSTTNC